MHVIFNYVTDEVVVQKTTKLVSLKTRNKCLHDSINHLMFYLLTSD